MSPSQAASEIFLMRVWQTSASLAGFALVIAFGLAFKRVLEARRQVRSDRRRAELSARVYALLASPQEPTAEALPPYRKGDAAEIFTIALDVLRVTRGRDADRMVELARLWGVPKHMRRVLGKGKRNLKVRVLTLLAHFRDEESLELLRSRIEDPALYVQLAALRGLADRGDIQSFARVVRALGNARTTNVPMLADILRRFGEPAVPALGALARSDGATPGVRLAATTALGSIGSLQAFEPLEILANHPDAGLRTRALESLGKLGDPRAQGAILAGLGAPEARVRAQAALSAGMLALRSAIHPLEERLSDEAWEVRYRAAEALYRMGPAGIAVLGAASGGTEGPAAEMARELLAEMEGIAA
jgi:hypothetical protein